MFTAVLGKRFIEEFVNALVHLCRFLHAVEVEVPFAVHALCLGHATRFRCVQITMVM